MTSGLTPRMAQCLQAIRDLTKDGVSPTVREIMEHTGVASPRNVHDTLVLLKERGVIDWMRRRSRSIRIVERPSRAELARLSSEDLRAVGQDALAILRQRAGLQSADPPPMSFIEETATETVDEAIEKVRSKPAFLSAVMRIAGERLAAMLGHDAAAAEHAKLSRRHHENSVRGRR